VHEPIVSATRLPVLPVPLRPWPGHQVQTRGGSVFVRHTPWTGPDPTPPSGTDDASAAGERATDPPVERALYVHGLGGAATNWTDMAGLLAVRVDGYALDLPGFGNSEPPARGGYSIQQHVQAVVDVLEWIADRPEPTGRETTAARRPVHLVGNSLGGLVCLLVASRRPDLVATLTLISPAMPVYRVPPAFERAIMLVLLPGVPALAERRMAGVTPEQRVRGMLQMCFADPSRVPASRLREAVEEMRARDEQPWAGQALTRSLRGLMTSYLRVGRANAWRAARSVSCPTLVLWGAQDRLVDPALAPRLAEAMPDARLHVAEGVGHVAMMEVPELAARLVLGLAEEVAATRVPAGRDDLAVRS
jgi:pimeloyl-ACP methyl ester carboxylesterase